MVYSVYTSEPQCYIDDKSKEGAIMKPPRICVVCKKEYRKNGPQKECGVKCTILNRIEKIDECWIWKGCKKGEYGGIKFNLKFELAHRMSYKIFKGEIPENLLVMHTCDNRTCVNPDHLCLGTHKENTQDMMKKGRMGNFIGEGNSQAILNEQKVLEIRDLHAKGMKIKEISKRFKVKYFTCVDVVNRRNWRHI